MTFNDKIKIEAFAEIYFDGVCSNDLGGVGGWGALILEKTNNNKTETKIISGSCGFTTINQMKMLACINAIESLKQLSNIIIYTDSKYIFNGITKWVGHWKKNNWLTINGDVVKNKNLWIKIDNLNLIHNISWKIIKNDFKNNFSKVNQIAFVAKENEKENLKKKYR